MQYLGVKIGHLIKASWRPYLISILKKEDIVGDRWKNEDELCKEYNMYTVSQETAGLFFYKTERNLFRLEHRIWRRKSGIVRNDETEKQMSH